jgi:hypothetical protein
VPRFVNGRTFALYTIWAVFAFEMQNFFDNRETG